MRLNPQRFGPTQLNVSRRHEEQKQQPSCRIAYVSNEIHSARKVSIPVVAGYLKPRQLQPAPRYSWPVSPEQEQQPAE